MTGRRLASGESVVAEGAGNPGRPLTVLVVDDDGAWRAALVDWLERENCTVVELASGNAVLPTLERHGADVVILDVQLPGLDGLDVLGFLKYRWPRLPVVITTSFGGQQTQDIVRKLGASGYLEKPFPMADLMAELRRIASAKTGQGGEQCEP